MERIEIGAGTMMGEGVRFMITTIFILLKRLKSGSGLQRRLELAETAG